jgi:hypothetical protein
VENSYEEGIEEFMNNGVMETLDERDANLTYWIAPLTSK